jgi:pimeloyl-ACP methyl ester carboxylesterase
LYFAVIMLLYEVTMADVLEQDSQWISLPEDNFYVPFTVAEPEELISDELLVFAGGLITTKGAAHELALEFADRTGQRVLAYRSTEYGSTMRDPMRQVPDRAGLIAETLIDHVVDPSSDKRFSIVGESAGGIIVASLLEKSGRVNRAVLDSAVGLAIRSQLQLPADLQEEADGLPVRDRSEFLYKAAPGGEKRAARMAGGLLGNSVTEAGHMLWNRDVRAIAQSTIGLYQDVLVNMARLGNRRFHLPQPVLIEALRLAAHLDSTPEIRAARAHPEHPTKVGVVQPQNDKIIPAEAVKATLQMPGAEVDKLDIVTDSASGHPYLISQRAEVNNQAVEDMLQLLEA